MLAFELNYSLMQISIIKKAESNIMDADYYLILGLKNGTPLTEDSKIQMKKAYKKLSKEYHPDKNKSKDAEEKFKRIKKAYEVLSDPKKKKKYDKFGKVQ